MLNTYWTRDSVGRILPRRCIPVYPLSPANSTEDDVRRFIEQSAVSAYYRKRLEKTLRKFFAFCGERLAIECPQK